MDYLYSEQDFVPGFGLPRPHDHSVAIPHTKGAEFLLCGAALPEG